MDRICLFQFVLSQPKGTRHVVIKEPSSHSSPKTGFGCLIAYMHKETNGWLKHVLVIVGSNMWEMEGGLTLSSS